MGGGVFFIMYIISLLSTKNLNLTKCRLVDVIKGLKSIAFFTKYLIISSIMISSPLTQKSIQQTKNQYFIMIITIF
jgi:hypothetical protein